MILGMLMKRVLLRHGPHQEPVLTHIAVTLEEVIYLLGASNFPSVTWGWQVLTGMS